MKIKLISCEALVREFCLAAAGSPHVLDLKFLAFGLHDTPTKLRETIQAEIDASDGGGYDAIALGYGLCSRGTAELRARSIPIIVARAHDCITLFLGSRERYREEFTSHPGTYYYSPGWIERKVGEVQQGLIEEIHEQKYRDRYAEYCEKYGEENAKFLIEQERGWLANYTRAAFIDMGIGTIERYRKFTQSVARERGWTYSELDGDPNLITRLANGDWESDDFLRVEPGQSITESFDDFVLKASE